ncbi:hypothetical protein [Butyricicoccus pullicaecorum]|nr:hypothetical protein [Butyricicoccus pullicaecorum]
MAQKKAGSALGRNPLLREWQAQGCACGTQMADYLASPSCRSQR